MAKSRNQRAVVVALAVTTVIAGGCVTTQPPTGSTTGMPTGVEVARSTPTNSRDATPAASDADSGDLASVGWYEWDQLSDAGDAAALRFGLLDGETDRVEIAQSPAGPFGAGAGPFPIADGPRAGTLIYRRDDGRRSELLAASVVTGESRLIVESDDIIWAAAIGLSGADVYYLIVGRATGAELGVWHLEMGGGGAPTLVLPPRDPTAGVLDVTLAARVAFLAALTLSADGSHLAQLVCAAACTLTVLDTTTGDVADYPLADPSPVIGLGSDVAVIDSIAWDGPYAGLLLVNLVTGSSTWLNSSTSGAVLESDGQDILVHAAGEEGRRPGTVFFATELRPGGTTRDLGRVADAWRVVPPSGQAVGVDVPPGWFLVASGPGFVGGRAAYFAVRMQDLHAIELDALGT
ncbi:MAG: hypothetical protein ABR509_00975 [Candidatus Limnocylindria bacterium]